MQHKHVTSIFVLSCNEPHRLGGGVLLYMGYIGVCSLKVYGFLAILVSNRDVSIWSQVGYCFCTLV